MTQRVEFSYGSAGAPELPFAKIYLKLGSKQVVVPALVDSGATLNVLPYDVGIQLGAIWEQQPRIPRLAGNLASADARGIVLEGWLEALPPVRLAFAWTQAPSVPVILGQMNFFLEYDVCFFRSQSRFEVQPKSQP
jgi:hypothetical protein